MSALRGRIAQARSLGLDPMESLLRDAPDIQVLIGELGRLLQLPVLKGDALLQYRPHFDLLPFAECLRRHCLIVSRQDEGDEPCLVLTDPFDTDLMAWARTTFRTNRVALASPSTLEAWLTHWEASISAMSAIDAEPASEGPRQGGAAEELDLRQIGSSESAAVRFVNSTLYDALRAGASDIHLEGDRQGVVVKFRLDGVLATMRRDDSVELREQVISRIKVMSHLDIAERRIPQDGRLQIASGGRTVDVRVSIMPSIHGEDAVLRILDRQHLAETLSGLTLAKLGFDDFTAQCIRKLCLRPHGMLLVTGPTGSGKTTTLYAAIAETHTAGSKIVTIEDPVEYHLPGVLQIPVNERKGLTFARGLRSILRHDPDKILVGEIRDAETAQIAVQSALTGHLVLTTVHANTALDVVGRFEQFGIDSYTLSSAINGVVAQRLLRRVCSACAQPMGSVPHGDPSDGSDSRVFLKAVGCERCRGTGYLGRFALGEILEFTPNVKALVSQRAPQESIQAEAGRSGWRPLRDGATQAAASGQTTPEEVDRVAG